MLNPQNSTVRKSRNLSAHPIVSAADSAKAQETKPQI